MYENLTKALRDCARVNSLSLYKRGLMKQAADAIEELSAAVEGYEANTNMVFDRSGNNTVVKFEPKWIPVTERLPEEIDQSRGEWSAEIRPSDDVLVWLSHEKRQSVAWYSHPYKEWTTVDENTVYCFEEVTHWMPLPEPPKEDA